MKVTSYCRNSHHRTLGLIYEKGLHRLTGVRESWWVIQKLIGKEIIVSLDMERTGNCHTCSSRTTSCVVLMDLFRRVSISIGGLAQERARETKKCHGPGPIASRGEKHTHIHGHAQAHTDTYTSTCTVTQHKHRSTSIHE